MQVGQALAMVHIGMDNHPTLTHINEISFHRPVPVGSVIEFKADISLAPPEHHHHHHHHPHREGPEDHGHERHSHGSHDAAQGGSHAVVVETYVHDLVERGKSHKSHTFYMLFSQSSKEQ